MNMNYDVFSQKEAFIFDVDGTLYSQTHMRTQMFFRLIFYYVFHLCSFKELLAIYIFRRLREDERFRAFSIEDLFGIVAERLNMSEKAVAASIQRWMFTIPLEIIANCSFKDVIEFAKKMHQTGKNIIIYSDYPAKEKISALDMPCDFMFISGEENLPELKPSIVAMNYIINQTGFSPDKLVYIGDRDRKDGESARALEISYCDIRQFRKLIKGKQVP